MHGDFPFDSRANLRPPSRSAPVTDRLLKNQNPLENRNNLRSSSPHLVAGRRPGNRASILRPKFMDAGAMAVPIASVRFGHSTTRREALGAMTGGVLTALATASGTPTLPICRTDRTPKALCRNYAPGGSAGRRRDRVRRYVRGLRCLWGGIGALESGLRTRHPAPAAPARRSKGYGKPKSRRALSRPILRRSSSLISQLSNQFAASA